MDFFKQLPDIVTQFLWLFIVAIVGGIVSFITKTNKLIIGKPVVYKIRILLTGIITSMFVAYLTFELLITVIDSSRLAIALSGLAAYIGTDLLIVVQEGLINKIKDRIEKL